MRKLLSILLLVLPLTVAVGQPAYSDLDTVDGLPPDYFVPNWYTQCQSFAADTESFSVKTFSRTCIGDFGVPVIAKEFFTPDMQAVRGMAALVAIDLENFAGVNRIPSGPPVRVPEYLSLMQGTVKPPVYVNNDSTQGVIDPETFPYNMTEVGTLRWDTVTPRVLRLPKWEGAVADSDHYYCYVYEVYFDTPLTVDNVFYVMGTYNSNILTPGSFYYEGYPTLYWSLREDVDWCDRCLQPDYHGIYDCCFFTDELTLWYWNNEIARIFGLFFPIVN